MHYSEAVKSLEDTLSLSSRDHSLNHRDAWIYGIIVGWGDSIEEVAKKHNWDEDTVKRLHSLHEALHKNNRT